MKFLFNFKSIRGIPTACFDNPFKLALPETTPNLFNYSHELLIRITSDDNVELVFEPKAEYANVVNSTPIVIFSTATDSFTPNSQ